MEWIRKPKTTGYHWCYSPFHKILHRPPVITWVGTAGVEFLGEDGFIDIGKLNGHWLGPVDPPDLPEGVE